MLYKIIQSERKRLEKLIKKIKYQINCLPNGTLSCVQTGKYRKWFLYDNSQVIYIKKKDSEIAKKLASKKYLTSLLSDYQHEMMAIDEYLKIHNTYPKTAESLLDDDSNYIDLLTSYFKTFSQEIDHWIKEPFEQNANYPEQLKIHTSSGNMVRSKSESIIDSALFRNHIPFRYECKLQIDDVIFYPDFTIRNPKTGKIIYWEHLGMMDKSDYIKRNYHKLETYTNAGIIPNLDLIITTETEDRPLSPELVDKVIEFYFL